MNYICIGDIHGRYDLLEQLLEKIAASPFRNHRKIFLGDMVDRGPDSYDVLVKVKELHDKEDAVVLFGNHEDFVVDAVNHRSLDTMSLWFYNGGKKTEKSLMRGLRRYGAAFYSAFPRHDLYLWIKSLPLHFEDKDIWCSHAPIPKEKYLEGKDFRKDKNLQVWTYHGNYGVSEQDLAMKMPGKLQVVGHIHAIHDGKLEPRVYEQIIYVDTGAGCWPEAPLGAVAIDDGKYVGSLIAWPKDPEEVKKDLAMMLGTQS